MSQYASSESPRSGFARLLPRGLPLGDQQFAERHRLNLAVIALHIPLLFGLEIFGPHGSTFALGEIGVLVLLPAAIAAVARHRQVASTSAALALLGISASVVELSGGSITAHFHFFISLALIALYQSWPVYLLAVGYTGVHHVVMALTMPMHLFSMGSPEMAHPVTWAFIHAGFMLGAAAAQVTFWRFAEASQIASAAAEAQAKFVVAEQLKSEQAAAEQSAIQARQVADALEAQNASRKGVDSQLSSLSEATTAVSGGVSAASQAVGSIDAAIREISSNVTDASLVASDAVASTLR